MAAGGALATSIGGFLAHHLGWFWHFVIGGSATVTMCLAYGAGSAPIAASSPGTYSAPFSTCTDEPSKSSPIGW